MLRFVLVDRGLGLGLGSGSHFGSESSVFRLCVSVQIDDLVSGFESSTFRVRFMLRIQCI